MYLVREKDKDGIKVDIHVGWIDRANNAGQHIDKGCSESLTLSWIISYNLVVNKIILYRMLIFVYD